MLRPLNNVLFWQWNITIDYCDNKYFNEIQSYLLLFNVWYSFPPSINRQNHLMAERCSQHKGWQKRKYKNLIHYSSSHSLASNVILMWIHTRKIWTHINSSDNPTVLLSIINLCEFEITPNIIHQRPSIRTLLIGTYVSTPDQHHRSHSKKIIFWHFAK